MSESLVLDARGIDFLSEHDESAFFEWAKRLKCVVSCVGVADAVRITVNRAAVDEYELRELIALFFRYHADLKQLRVFQDSHNETWLKDADKYWHAAMFA